MTVSLLTTGWNELPGSSGPGRIFAIGDVHGRADLLGALLAQIPSLRSGSPAHLVFLGDLVDRGPDSLKCLALARDAKASTGVDTATFLWGNHEILLSEALKDPEDCMDPWLWNGGRAVLREAGLEGIRDRSTIAARLHHLIGDPAFFPLSLTSHVEAGDLLFVHAGVHPERDMALFLARPPCVPEDLEEHWAWTRHAFLDWQGGWEHARRVIVHGHTPVTDRQFGDESELALFTMALGPKRRIALDGGAGKFPGGHVLMGEFKEGRVRVHAAFARGGTNT